MLDISHYYGREVKNVEFEDDDIVLTLVGGIKLGLPDKDETWEKDEFEAQALLVMTMDAEKTTFVFGKQPSPRGLQPNLEITVDPMKWWLEDTKAPEGVGRVYPQAQPEVDTEAALEGHRIASNGQLEAMEGVTTPEGSEASQG